MSDHAGLETAADAIGDEIGLDTSYFVPPDQLDFDPITIGTAVGLILLSGFLDGVRKGLQDQAKAAGEGTVTRLADAFSNLFKHGRQLSTAEVEATAAATSAAAEAAGPARLSAASEMIEIALTRYFRDLGMPDTDARRLASRVRTEGLAQVQTPAQP